MDKLHRHGAFSHCRSDPFYAARADVADRVAPPTASKAPLSEDQIRAAIGALFFVLSVMYVVRTIQQLVKQQKD